MEYTLKLTENDLSVLDRLLVEAPYRIAAPLIDKINQQVMEQQKAEDGNE